MFQELGANLLNRAIDFVLSDPYFEEQKKREKAREQNIHEREENIRREHAERVRANAQYLKEGGFIESLDSVFAQKGIEVTARIDASSGWVTYEWNRRPYGRGVVDVWDMLIVSASAQDHSIHVSGEGGWLIPETTLKDSESRLAVAERVVGAPFEMAG